MLAPGALSQFLSAFALVFGIVLGYWKLVPLNAGPARRHSHVVTREYGQEYKDAQPRGSWELPGPVAWSGLPPARPTVSDAAGGLLPG